MIIENKEALLKEREAAREELASYKCRILVCAGTGCVASGSEKIYQKMTLSGLRRCFCRIPKRCSPYRHSKNRMSGNL